MYQQAQTWQARPSSLLGIDPSCEYLCYCFDEAVLYFGRWVDKWLDKRHTTGNNKGKRVYSLTQILNDEFVESAPGKQSLGGLLMLMGGAAGVNPTPSPSPKH